MVTDKDREELKELTKQIRKSDQCVQWFDYGWNECAEIITQYVNKKCAESAEQARKEAATFEEIKDFLISKSGAYKSEYIQSAIIMLRDCFGSRAAILSPLQNAGNGEQVPSERNKLECIKSMRATLLAIAQTPIAYVCEKTRKLARAEWEKSKGFEE